MSLEMGAFGLFRVEWVNISPTTKMWNARYEQQTIPNLNYLPSVLG